MKRYFVSVLIVVCLGTFSWAQGTKELFDAKKSQEELEIMKGILGTTMSFVSQNLQRQAASATAGTTKPAAAYSSSSFRMSNINAFYLYGQGAVFVIPGSSFRLSNNFGILGAYNGDMVASLDLANSRLAELSSEVALAALEADKAAVETGIRGGVAGGIMGGVAPAPSPKAAQTPKPQSVLSQEDFQKKLAEQLEKTKKSREDMLANRAKFQKILGEMKGYLIEALANYGDSLTTVKPNEYITIVIDDTINMWGVNPESDATSREVVSVQKSWITDYKAGRLTLDAFKQKALQYKE